MSIESPSNERLKLYERFKKSLADGADNEFFDADDLIIIIDQAVDLNDEYVQIEALMRGYRFFPDNEELANRRAFLYFDLNLNDGIDDMLARHNDGLPMWTLLRLRQKEDEVRDNDALREQARQQLTALMDQAGKFDDETMIQFVDCAAACGLYSWLEEVESRLRTKTDYLPTLLYELFVVADMRADYDYCIKLLEELTELEPFNVDFWCALAQTQMTLDYNEDALSSIDYALAIDSENATILALKASVLIQLEQSGKAMEIIEPLMKSELTAQLAALHLHALYGLGDVAACHDALNKYIRLFPADSDMINMALFMNVPDVDELLDLHYATCSAEDRANWGKWARGFFVGGKLAQTAAVLSCMRRHTEIAYADIKTLATAYYCDHQYALSVELLDDALGNEEYLLIPDVVVGGLLASRIIYGQKRTKQLYDKLMTKSPMVIREEWNLSYAMQDIGFTTILTLLEKLLNTSDPVDVTVFDFLRMPSNYTE